jgi:hypothetical protein
MKQKKKHLTLIISMILIMGMFTIFPTVQATDFHVIKGTLIIDGSVAGAGIDIELDVLDNTFIIETFEQDENGYNFVSQGFDDETYGGATVYFTVIYDGKSYTPIYNTSIDLDKDTEDVEKYILDLNIDTTEPANNPPNTPSNPSPGNGATGISTSADLGWSCSDPDDDTITYDIYFGTSSTPPLKKSGHNSKSYDVGTLSYKTTYYWQIVAEDEHGLTAPSSIWSFTTKEKSSGGGGGDPGGGGGSNTAPTADAGGPYVGVVGEASTDSDGEIVEYHWDFDNNGNYDTEWSDSPTATHTYSSGGEFTVKLQVKDNGGLTATDSATVSISIFNNPPTKPQISGPKTGSKNNDYDYSAVSTDVDNDTIQYTFYWDDGTNSTTDFTDNGIQVTTSHRWSAYGFYTITVEAYDGQTNTWSDEYEVAIDVIRVKDIGYLIDSDSDGNFESFYSNQLGAITATEKQIDDTYLINSDEDDNFDWQYDPVTDTLTEYTLPSSGDEAEEQDFTLWYALIIVVIVIILLAFVAKGRKKPAPEKKLTPEKKPAPVKKPTPQKKPAPKKKPKKK